MSNPILYAYDFNGQGGGNVISDIKEASLKIAQDELAWVHLDVNNPETKGWPLTLLGPKNLDLWFLNY